MLIPSIDLKNGRVVQLVQGERLAIESDDLDGWVARFSAFPKVQLIDLDAAMGSGDNDALVRRVAPRLPCRVGGGIRSIARAEAVLGYGSQAVIVSSALFRDGRPDLDVRAVAWPTRWGSSGSSGRSTARRAASSSAAGPSRST